MEDTSALFELLTAESRRQVLFLLLGAESIQVPEALRRRGATSVQGSQGGPPSAPPRRGAPSADRRLERLDAELSHFHLPKLAQRDLVEWDRERGAVARGPAFEDVEPLLRLLAENASRLPDDLF